MIQNLKVKGLNDRFDYELEFHEDLNIITGPNGSGKTTLLKLIWYLTSGNLHRIIPEISLTSVQIRTSQFDLSLQPVEDEVRLEWKFDNGDQEQKSITMVRQQTDVLNAMRAVFEFVKELTVHQQTDVLNALNKEIANAMPGSLFFSTFGKLEGNYTAEPKMVELLAVLSEFSKALSVGHHKFMPAISTYDITELLKQKYNDIYEDIDRIDDNRQTLVERWKLLDEIVADIYGYEYNGIRIVEHIILGENRSTEDRDFISLNNLSFGERRLLGFLCYNAFSEEKTIFINEPESSLDPDWQKLLPSILKLQGTEKQIFLTTRSPYIGIGTRFSEKIIHLNK